MPRSFDVWSSPASPMHRQSLGNFGRSVESAQHQYGRRKEGMGGGQSDEGPRDAYRKPAMCVGEQ
jgi:hypothetical protein